MRLLTLCVLVVALPLFSARQALRLPLQVRLKMRLQPTTVMNMAQPCN